MAPQRNSPVPPDLPLKRHISCSQEAFAPSPSPAGLPGLPSLQSQPAPSRPPAQCSPVLANSLSKSQGVSGTGKQRDCGGREAPL